MFTRFINHSARDRCNSWHLVVLFNLIVAGSLGLMVTEGLARLGMATGIVLLWYAGLRIVVRSPLLGTALIWGGVFVGLCQIIPLGHFYLGGWAVALSNRLDNAQGDHVHLTSFLGGLSATCITGGVLMMLSMIMGLVILGLSELATPSSPNSDQKYSQKPIPLDPGRP
ncbi:MAG: hypothetical protein QM703_05750 [Gemmatales bacterium]